MKEKNNELIVQLKRLSQEVDEKVSRMKLGVQEPPKSEEVEGKLMNEIECLKKMEANYEKEIELLRTKLKVKTGTETVVDMEKKATMEIENKGTLQKQINEYKKQIKDTAKELEKASARKENGTSQIEVRLAV